MSLPLADFFQAVASEATRACVEYTSYAFRRPDLLRMTPQGDGHPVLLLPGFFTTSDYLNRLKGLVREKGYAVHSPASGINTGRNEYSDSALDRWVEDIYHAHGARTGAPTQVSICGYSLGGHQAREIARRRPDLVRNVITLGSPIDIRGFSSLGTRSHENTAVIRYLREAFSLLNPGAKTQMMDESVQLRLRTPPPVPTTSIFSSEDMVVPWLWSLNPAAERAENIGIVSSHAGMPHNADAALIVLDRLAQTPDGWTRFQPQRYEPYFRSYIVDGARGETPQTIPPSPP